MPDHRRFTGYESQRRIDIIEIFAGGATALWLIPITLAIGDAAIEVIMASVTSVGGCTIAALVGLAIRAQRRTALWQQETASRAEHAQHQLAHEVTLNIEAVTSLVVENHNELVDLRRQLTNFGMADQATHDDLLRRVNGISGKLDRGAWDIYADALTDQQGGPDAVNSQITKAITYDANKSRERYAETHGNVVQFPKAAGGTRASGGGGN